MIERNLLLIHKLKRHPAARIGFILLVCMGSSFPDLQADAKRATLGVSVSAPVSVAPVVSSFQPEAGIAGTTITLTGLNFRNVTHISLNDVVCSSFTVWGDDRITAEVPIGATSGLITVRADQTSGTSTMPFLVISQPEINEVVPDSSAPDHSVIMRGNGFWGVQEVLFDSVAASRFWVHSDSEIEAFVPFGASSGRIEVSGPAGHAASPDLFRVLLPPDVLVFEPTEDTYVVSNGPTATHGGASILQIKKTSSQEHRALLKFRVIGMWAQPDTVKLRLHVVNSGDHGGAVYHVSNDYGISATGWIENALNWSNAPPLTGTAIDSVGETIDNQIVEFDVTDIVTEDGHYSFALVARSSDVVRYSSREGEVIPELVAKFAPMSDQGAGSGPTDFETTGGGDPVTSVFTPTDDSYVRSSRPTEGNGTAIDLRVRKSSVDRNAYLKFTVSGLSEPVRSAVLRLHVLDGSEEGGTIHVVSNQFSDNSGSWTERTLTWQNAPAIGGTALENIGSVEAGQYLEIDVASVITADGTYSFGIKNRSSDLASYSSKEGSFAPELIVESGAEVFPTPEVTSFSALSGLVGDEITIFGNNFRETTSVKFNGADASVFSSDSRTQVRVVVPAAASTGPLTITNPYGSASSSADFHVLVMPQIISFEPSSGSGGTEVTITAANLDQVSGVSFNGISVADFSVDSATTLRVAVPADATTGSIALITQFGSTESESEFAVIEATPGEASVLSFVPTDDSFVRSTRSSKNYGDDDELRVRDSSSAEYDSYLKFHVKGLASVPDRAILRLHVIDGGPSGGSLYVVSNNFKGSSNPWTEIALAWENAPSLPSDPIHSLGAVTVGEVVEIEVTSIIGVNGTYSFAMKNASSDAVKYSSKEGSAPPELVIHTAGEEDPSSSPATVAGFNPISGTVGTVVTITGENLGELTAVLFNGEAAADFEIESDSQLKATVPEGATTGPIQVNAGERYATSENDFQVEVLNQPVITSLSPLSGPVGSEVTITGVNLDDVNEVLFDATPASIFSVVSSTRILVEAPTGAIAGQVSVVSAAGLGTSEQSFTVTDVETGPQRLTPSDDSFVRSNEATKNYGNSPELRLRQTSSAKYVTYIKFNVAGLAGPVPQASLLLTVVDAGAEGGTVYLAQNHFKDSLSPWNEKDLNWENAPALIGSGFVTLGPVSLGEVVEIDVTSQITGNGEYTFALSHQSSDATKYSSKEGTAAPLLVIGSKAEPDDHPGDEPTSTVTISSFSPSFGPIGTEVTVLGENLSRITDVRFNETSAVSFSVESDSELRTLVPAGATTGKINLVGSEGVVSSEDDFEVQTVSGTVSFIPVEDTFIRSGKPSKNYGSSSELRARKASSDSTITFFKFLVDGVGGEVTTATLKLFVLDASSNGGAIYSVSNNLRGTAIPWNEDNLVWTNFPTLDGPVLSQVGSVSDGQTVELELTDAIRSDGTFSFALLNDQNDVVKYSSKESTVLPQLIVETGAPSQNRSQTEVAKAAPLPAGPKLPERIELRQNFPNPFNIETYIVFTLPIESKVQLFIYNLKGQTIRRLLDGRQPPGTRRVSWDGKNDQGLVVSSGTYFVQLNVAEQKFVRRITLQK